MAYIYIYAHMGHGENRKYRKQRSANWALVQILHLICRNYIESKKIKSLFETEFNIMFHIDNSLLVSGKKVGKFFLA